MLDEGMTPMGENPSPWKKRNFHPEGTSYPYREEKVKPSSSWFGQTESLFLYPSEEYKKRLLWRNAR